ncbi:MULTISPECIES: zinc-ribbon domain-containing protein [Mycobacteriaceae]|uniref:zinc-ribbon domain-containing protein n=1 Tax=Mycobacteriaceae TaxID=1762 RepID=UPI0007FE4814|nr:MULTISPECIES: zinc-ribbon domain-containing protein [Mycobacteriaceae]MCK0174984.1 zinc ribbon domain-containing protein [Mycolicibacterium sp. F2034L]OBB61377.1 zinc-ribbon domain-containing protein [Mycobacterium sp. 852013-51886_SCH5428379]
MFFFIVGLSTKQKYLGAGGVRTCPRCHNNSQWSRMKEYRQFTLFFIPIARWKRRNFEVCGICGSAVAV